MDRGWHESKRVGKLLPFYLYFDQSFRIAGLLFAGGGYFVALATFLGVAGMNPRNPLILYILMFIFNGACLLLYVILQIFLVLNTLHDRWPIGKT